MQPYLECQADLFGFSPPGNPRSHRHRNRGDAGHPAASIDDFRSVVDDALQDLGRQIDRAVETLRDALGAVEDNETREAITEAIEELDTELTSVLDLAKIEIGL
ncbi:hypothetical protein NKH37_30930 [Mesorhizobium sp. M1217]|uniref:hypothetical protein n=1 Tax=Mesorhizobium sp. M1217 TaxID=2957070 RepID=UPI00333677AC